MDWVLIGLLLKNAETLPVIVASSMAKGVMSTIIFTVASR